MRDAYGERIQEGAGKAHVGGHIHHQHAHESVIAHGHDQRDDDAHERNRFLAHPENGPREGKKHRQRDKHENVPLADSGDEPLDARLHRPGRVQQPEGSAHDQDEDDDAGLLHEPVIDGRQHLPRLRDGIDLTYCPPGTNQVRTAQRAMMTAMMT